MNMVEQQTEEDEEARLHLAIQCQHLRRTIDSSRIDGPVVTLCTHTIRDGFDCVGPFMDDIPTTCGLWERGTLVFARSPR